MQAAALAPASSAINPTAYAVARVSEDIGASTYRLASGNRIHRTADDPASVLIASTLDTQLSGLRQGRINGARADSLLQVAAQALTQISGLLETLEGITTEADTGALSDRERVFLDVSFQDNVARIDAIVGSTSFGGKTLLDGTYSPFDLAVGDGAGSIEVTIDAVDTASLFSGATPNIATQAAAQAALPVVQAARETVGIALAEVESAQAEIAASETTRINAVFDIDTARRALVDTDVPRESARFNALTLQQQVGVTVAAQTQSLSSGLLDLLKFSVE